MTLLEALKYVRDSRKDPKAGICVLIEKVLLRSDYCSVDVADEYYEELRRMFRRWPDVYVKERIYGPEPDVNYPVGGMGEYHSKDLWANPRRHALLNWLIQELENEE